VVVSRESALAYFERGVTAREAFPELPKEEREFLISGTSPSGWRKLFGGAEDSEEDTPGRLDVVGGDHWCFTPVWNSRLIQRQVRDAWQACRATRCVKRETAAVYCGERLVEVLNVADLGTMDVSIRCDGFNCNGPDFTLQANVSDQLATVRRSQMALKSATSQVVPFRSCHKSASGVSRQVDRVAEDSEWVVRTEATTLRLTADPVVAASQLQTRYLHAQKNGLSR
jgi:hypothetical protein